MRFLRVVLLGCFVLIGSCSDKGDNGTGPEPGSTFHVVLGDRTDTVAVDGLPRDTIDGQATVRLSAIVRSEFIQPYIDKDTVAHDTRGLYAYRLVGADGFNPHDNRGYDDNVWAHLDLGYYLIDDDRSVFPDENIDLPGAFNIKSLRTIRIFRKIDVVTDTGTAFQEIDDLPVVQVQNLEGEMEDAVGLWLCITAPYVSEPSARQYRLRTVDDFSPPAITWDQLQTGYWLLNTQRTIFTAPELNQGKYKVSVLEAIDVTTP
jgi:hypothetical protein